MKRLCCFQQKTTKIFSRLYALASAVKVVHFFKGHIYVFHRLISFVYNQWTSALEKGENNIFHLAVLTYLKDVKSLLMQGENAVNKNVLYCAFPLGGHIKILHSIITLALLSPRGLVFHDLLNGSRKPKNMSFLCKQRNNLWQYLLVHNRLKNS